MIPTPLALFVISTMAFAGSTAPEVVPGVSFPAEGIVFAYDGHALTRLRHHPVKLNRHAGSNIAKANLAPLMFKPIATLELDGAAAAIELKSDMPTFYYFYPVREEQEQDGEARNSLALVKVSTVKDRRVVGGLSFGRITGNPERVLVTVACKTERVDDDWVKIVPQAKLEHGEYAITHVPEESGEFDGSVYDFSLQ